MSSNLPPGVTDADIERQAGGDSLLEAFERHLNKQEGGKSLDDEACLDTIYNFLDSRYQEFVERAMQWAYEQGQKDGWESARMEPR